MTMTMQTKIINIYEDRYNSYDDDDYYPYQYHDNYEDTYDYDDTNDGYPYDD